MRRREILFNLGAPAQEGAHICYIYNDEEDRQRTLSGFVQCGLTGGENVLCLVDSMTTAEFRRCLCDMGLKVEGCPGSFCVKEASSAYCPEEEFSCPDTLDLLRRFYMDAAAQGRTGARVTGEASWALERNKLEDLMMYEAQVNQVLEHYPCTACCQYDARRFDGQMIMDVLSVHPMMLVHGQIVHNPFYVEPMRFLNDYRQRCGKGANGT